MTATCPTGMTFVIGTDTKLYGRTEVTDDNLYGKSWVKVDETAKIDQISCGKGGYLLALIGGYPYFRTGIDLDTPYGSKWDRVTFMW